ncbi:hypothetical protein DFH08DRAFT_973846 [Mycena albidolilacea]|uniref:DUF4470 domain-containing protein n=1 Tax=Mycena albidolilacea TaxID=1033008 RepID=A0AAD7EC81_9AGAR|nr:hypothetical protein DFH08DRAFT_973846 [Mycena albidolilacea]
MPEPSPKINISVAQAAQAKAKGNSAFKESKWLLAARQYKQAEKLDPTNPVYPSNLSAALFEMGSYNECASAILRSFALLDLSSSSEEKSSLAPRLSAQLAKSLSQALAAGTSVSLKNGVADQIARIEKAYSADEPAWTVWRSSMDGGESRLEVVDFARERLLSLPILKKSPVSAREYYTISHDDIYSLLDKSSEEQGPSPSVEEDALDIKACSNDKLSKLAFLFGGPGDARHAFGTVKCSLKVHITLLDVKEHALARDLVVMFLLSKIMSCTDADEKLELQATLFYLLCAVAKEMVAKISENPVNFLPWVRLDFLGVPAIKSALALWATLPEKNTASYVAGHRYSEDDQNAEFRLTRESKWYKNTKAFIPPSAFWNRHPDSCFGPNAKSQTAAKDVKTSWIVNPTLFDSAEGPDIILDATNGDTFCVIRQIAAFQRRHPVSACVFNNPSARNSYILEFIHGDIQSRLLRMRAHPEARVAQNLPVKYTKMWLSNVPDYINGPLDTAIFVVPSLQDTTSSASANHLLNFTAFMGEPTSFSNTYAHLQARDFPSYLGCRAIYMDAFDVTSLVPLTLPRPNPDLAKREDLKIWLIRTFLCTLLTGKSSGMAKIIGPKTLVAFIHLLIHLHKAGYPGHWLGDFLGTLLSNTLVPNILPYTDTLPISPRHDWTRGRPIAKLHLDPWIADMEAVVARIYPALPFAFPLLAQFPAADDIGLYRANMYCYGEQTIYDPVAALLFFNPAKVRFSGQADRPRNILAILRGDGPCKATDICIVLTMEAPRWDPGSRGEMQWRMSRARVARMKAEGWAVAIYGTHNEAISA